MTLHLPKIPQRGGHRRWIDQASFSYIALHLWGIWGVWHVSMAHVIENELPHWQGAVGEWGKCFQNGYFLPKQIGDSSEKSKYYYI
jgi:hypothetical protein